MFAYLVYLLVVVFIIYVIFGAVEGKVHCRAGIACAVAIFVFAAAAGCFG